MVDAGGDQLDAVGPGAVELHQLVGLDRVGCADGVAAADHGGLGGFAGGRFVVAGGGLDPGEGVEGGDQRQVEPVLEVVGRNRGQPVVGVQRLDRGRGQVGSHAVAELSDDRREVLLGQLGRAGGDVHHLEARFDPHAVGKVVGPAAHVDPHVDAGLGQRGRQLTHVDVHAAGVAGAGLRERRGVEGDDGDGTHGQINLAAGGSIPARRDRERIRS